MIVLPIAGLPSNCLTSVISLGKYMIVSAAFLYARDLNGSPCRIIISANSSIISINSLFITLPFGKIFKSVDFSILMGDFDCTRSKFAANGDLLLLLEGNLSTIFNFRVLASAFFLVPFFKSSGDLDLLFGLADGMLLDFFNDVFFELFFELFVELFFELFVGVFINGSF